MGAMGCGVAAMALLGLGAHVNDGWARACTVIMGAFFGVYLVANATGSGLLVFNPCPNGYPSMIIMLTIAFAASSALIAILLAMGLVWAFCKVHRRKEDTPLEE